MDDNQIYCPMCGTAVVNNDYVNYSEFVQQQPNSASQKCKKEKTKKAKKPKRRYKAIIACICSVALIVSGVLGGLYWKINSAPDLPDENYVFFESGFTDVKVTDEKSALEAVASVSGAIGISDVNKELKIKSADTIDNNTYYRFQQYYNNILVYGKTVSVCADEKGNAEALTSNFKHISKLPNEYTSDMLNADDVVIYGNKFNVCSVSYKETENETNIVFTDVSTGEIIDYKSITYTDSAPDYISKQGEKSFLLYDEKRNVKMLNSNKEILAHTREKIEDDSKKKYKIVFYTNNNAAKRRDVEDSYYFFKNEKIYVEYVINNKIQYVTSNKENGFDNNAVTVIENVEKAYDYFLKKLDRKGFDNNNSRMFVAYNDKISNDEKGGNSYSYSGFLLNFGYNENYNAVDLIAHEFTHSVEFTISNMDYCGETGAIMEAYSDIFGELVEEYAANKPPDWVFNSQRNMIEPEKSELPKTYKGNYWADTKEKLNKNGKTLTDHGGVHTNHAVLSHAAYLMWSDGADKQKLSSDSLAKLLYRALFLMNSDETFAQFRNAVELTARIMVKNKELTDEQYISIQKTFDEVGIQSAPCTYNKVAKNDFDLSVLNYESTEYVNFNLVAYKMPTFVSGPGLLIDLPKKVIDQNYISGLQHIHLDDGVYYLIISDLENENSKNIGIKLVVDGNNEDSNEEVKIYTDFTSIMIAILDDDTIDNFSENESELKELLKKNTSKNIIAFSYDDFDFDGEYEAFAFVGESIGNDEYSEYKGELWFVNSSECSKLVETSNYYTINYLIPFENQKFVCLNNIFGNGSTAKIWTVIDGKAKECNISGDSFETIQLFDKNCLTVVNTDFDGVCTLNGNWSSRTNKQYYYFWDKNESKFKEYGGVEISKEQFSSLNGADSIEKYIASKGYSIDKLYYRGNNVININCKKYESGYGTYYNNITLRYTKDKNSVEEIDGENWDGKFSKSSFGGVYKKALREELAVYPTEIPFKSAVLNKKDVPSDASAFGGHNYKVIKSETVGWHEAKIQCEKIGGHLATISDEKENDFIFDLVNHSGVQCWLGGTDEKKEGEWEWVTGEKWDYSNYDFDNRDDKQNYLVMGYYDTAIWDDQSEQDGSSLCKVNGYVCEWDY